MVLEGKLLDAHDKHYADDVVQQETEDFRTALGLLRDLEAEPS